MKLQVNVVLCVLLLALAESARSADLPERSEVFRMLRQERYDDLEKIIAGLRGEKLDLLEAQPKLYRFYDSLEIARSLDDRTWSNHLALLEGWARARPNSPAPFVALATVQTSYAWKARGGGYANTVSDQGWRLYGQRLDDARQSLETATNLPVKDPEAFRALIVVAMGQSRPKPEIDAIFKAGAAVEPNYLPLYKAKAYYLLPRWHGDPGDWEAFAKQSADQRGGAEGDLLYLQIARSQAWSEGADLFDNTRISYDRMKRGFEIVLNRLPDDLWEINDFCYFACIAGDRSRAKELFEKINGRWEKSVWDEEAHFHQWRNWAQHGGPAPRTSHTPRTELPEFVKHATTTVILVGGVLWVIVLALVGLGIWAARRGNK